nr:FUSC family protein [Furfurilactobacillus milii]
MLVLLCAFLIVLATGITVQASGLVEETINTHNEYSKYPLNNYQLDYFVDSSWDWLPWNWGDGIGKSVMFGVYAITNFLWLVSVYLSSATGYLVSEAYSLDFIKDTSDAIGKNVQTLAGVSQHGFSSTGFYPGMMLLLILVLGVYVAYVGMLKHETSKAISAIVNFVTIFIVSASFIAFAPNYIDKVNGFSSDIATSALNTGSKLIMQNDKGHSQNGVDAIRDTLFTVQVKQPWTLLQFGDSDPKKVGQDRIDKLAKTSPFKDKGKARTELVKDEIEKKDNDNLSAVKTINRLGVTVFIVLFNIVITIFVFILTAIMIFSQVLFIIYAIFLPIACLLAMIPSFNGMLKTTIMKLFNVIMMRAGITLVLTMAFCLSTLIYGLSATTPFFLVAFLQIVVFGGIYLKLSDLMGLMSLHSSDVQNGASQLHRRGQNTVRRFMTKVGLGALAGQGLSSLARRKASPATVNNSPTTPVSPHARPQAVPQAQTTGNKQTGQQTPPVNPRSKAEQFGSKVGQFMDTKERLKDKALKAKDQLKDLPINTKYGLQKKKEATKKGLQDFKQSAMDQRIENELARDQANRRRRQTIKDRKLALTKRQQEPQAKVPVVDPIDDKHRRQFSKRPTSSVESSQKPHKRPGIMPIPVPFKRTDQPPKANRPKSHDNKKLYRQPNSQTPPIPVKSDKIKDSETKNPRRYHIQNGKKQLPKSTQREERDQQQQNKQRPVTNKVLPKDTKNKSLPTTDAQDKSARKIQAQKSIVPSQPVQPKPVATKVTTERQPMVKPRTTLKRKINPRLVNGRKDRRHETK